jgi:hypothetical protein
MPHYPESRGGELPCGLSWPGRLCGGGGIELVGEESTTWAEGQGLAILPRVGGGRRRRRCEELALLVLDICQQCPQMSSWSPKANGEPSSRPHLQTGSCLNHPVSLAKVSES